MLGFHPGGTGSTPVGSTRLGDKMYQYDVYVKFGTNREQVVETFFDDEHDDALKEAKAFLDRNHKKFNSARIVKRIVPLL